MIYHALRRQMNPFLAAVLQGAAFGLLHPFGLPHDILAGLGGVCLALVYEWRRTLVVPIIAHALFNALGIATGLSAIANTPVLGVRADNVDGGCRIVDVGPDSGATQAGLRVGDVIVAVDDEPVATFPERVDVIRSMEPGQRIAVDFIRDGKTLQVDVVLKARGRAWRQFNRTAERASAP